MKHLTSNEIRTLWLAFFKEKKHLIIDGANLIPHNDKTLLWINSGVAALKPYFDGSKIPPSRRLVNVQKSIRTNDIDNVGVTNRHHTFFEMLGNFSLGDYFRKEAIAWGFEFLTNPKWLGLPVDKLYFTYHPSDSETRELWLREGVKPAQIVASPSNFWEIGEGPCGPNTEIFFDLGAKLDPENKGVKLLEEDIDNERYLEIWNIVFSQFNAKSGVKREDYEELPSKNIDTGAGLERIASVMQGVATNYETDLFMPVITELEKISNTKYSDNIVSYRVISDHIRTCVFALSDGASFSNEGRGYVLRRLLRRAMRYGQKLGLTKPFLGGLVDSVITAMGEFYPEIALNKAKVMRLIEAEENRFVKTLNHGEKLVRDLLDEHKALTGEHTFMLYDTYGFPFELTAEIALEYGVSVNKDEFDELLEAQKERARKARGEAASMQRQSKDLLEFTNPSSFVDNVGEVTSVVSALFRDGERITSGEDVIEVITKVTPFYAESGGQISDSGVVEGKDYLGKVTALYKAPHGQHVHKVETLYGSLREGMEVTLKIDQNKRELIEQNHTATHLLHKALNVILGEGANQAGSYVGDDYLRFDFTYDKKLTYDELAQIEALVNRYINERIPLVIQEMTLDEALARGAKAFFGEKYGSKVRVVEFGDVSRELCGGTHVINTGLVGTFALMSEGSIASGIRRIEAVSGLKAYEYLKQNAHLLAKLQNDFNVKDTKELLSTTAKLRAERQSLSEANKILKREVLQAVAAKLKATSVGEVPVYIAHFSELERDDLFVLSDIIKNKRNDAVIIFTAQHAPSVALLVTVSKDSAAKAHAGTLVKALTKAYGGSGGGRPDFANGQLPQFVSAELILKIVKETMHA